MHLSESDLRLLDAFFQLLIMFSPLLLVIVPALLVLIGYRHGYEGREMRGFNKHVH